MQGIYEHTYTYAYIRQLSASSSHRLLLKFNISLRYTKMIILILVNRQYRNLGAHNDFQDIYTMKPSQILDKDSTSIHKQLIYYSS